MAAQTDDARVAPPTPARRAASRRRELPPSFGQPVSAFRTIAIDPGHGGDDEGVKGADGVKEKDLTLAVARRVKGVDRSAARPPRAADARRRPQRAGRRAHGGRQQQQGRSVHQPARQRLDAAGDAGASIFVAAFDRDAAQAARRPAASALPTFGGGSRDIELVPWDLAQTRHLDQSAAFADLLEQRSATACRWRREPVDRAPLRVLESANMPAVLIEMGYLTNPEQEKLLAGDAFQNAVVQALFDAIVKFRDTLSRQEARTDGPPRGRRRHPRGDRCCSPSSCSSRRGLPRVGRAARRRPRPRPRRQRRRQPPGRKIKARLFYVADDGTRLTSVERDVAYGEGAVEQAREIIAAQIAPVAEPLVSAIPPGTTLRAVFITETGEAYVDLSREARTAHPGGTVNELLTVYTIVNALTANLPAVTAVQMLVDGKEVDTLSGHVDLRRPLAKNLAWVQ